MSHRSRQCTVLNPYGAFENPEVSLKVAISGVTFEGVDLPAGSPPLKIKPRTTSSSESWQIPTGCRVPYVSPNSFSCSLTEPYFHISFAGGESHFEIAKESAPVPAQSWMCVPKFIKRAIAPLPLDVRAEAWYRGYLAGLAQCIEDCDARRDSEKSEIIIFGLVPDERQYQRTWDEYPAIQEDLTNNEKLLGWC